MRYPKLRELKEAVRALVQGPVTTEYPHKPHTPYPKFRGKPRPSDKECIACGACALVCPAGAIEVKEHTGRKPPVRELIWHYDRCVYCGQCECLCTTQKGVHLTEEYDLATADRAKLKGRIEKELVVCEQCGEVIGPKAQLLWLFKRLGPLASGNYTLVYTAQKELGLAEDVPCEPAEKISHRGELYTIVCPRCRHKNLVSQTGKKT